jgi:hypothetical protein
VTESKEELRQQFDSLCLLNPNSPHLLTIYGKFLLEVTNEERSTVKVLDKADAML